METIIEVIRHVFIGSSCVIENADLLREYNINYLLGASNSHSLRDRRARFVGGVILGCKNIHIKDTILEAVDECNDYIHFCRINGFNLLIHSPRSLPLSSLLILLYLMTVSTCSLDDITQLLCRFRPDHDFDAYSREWRHFASLQGPWKAERHRLGRAWNEKQPALDHFDNAILTQLQMESRRMLRRSHNRPVQTCDSQEEQLLTWKSLEEYRRSLLVDKAVKEEAQRREMKERRMEEMYQMTYVPDYKLTYDCHEFDESIFYNARQVDFYLPSTINSMMQRTQETSIFARQSDFKLA